MSFRLPYKTASEEGMISNFEGLEFDSIIFIFIFVDLLVYLILFFLFFSTSSSKELRIFWFQLIIPLMFFGSIIKLRGVQEFWKISTNNVSYLEYGTLLGLTLTFFALVFGFYTLRSSEQSVRKEKLVLSLLSQFHSLFDVTKAHKSKRKCVLENLNRIISERHHKNNVVNGEPYHEIVLALDTSIASLDNNTAISPGGFINDTKAKLNELAYSIQFSGDPIFKFAVIFTGLLTIFAAVIIVPSLPEAATDGSLRYVVISDTFTWLYASIIASLLLSAHQKDNQRLMILSSCDFKNSFLRSYLKKAEYDSVPPIERWQRYLQKIVDFMRLLVPIGIIILINVLTAIAKWNSLLKLDISGSIYFY